MGEAKDAVERFYIEVLRTVPRGKLLKTEIYGVCARRERGDRRLFAPRGSKNFCVQVYLPILLSADRALNELLRGVVAHALEAMVARRDLDEDGEIAAGTDGNGELGDLYP